MVIRYSKNEKGITFGRVTFWSWVRAYFGKKGNMLKIKPIKGYEEYNYYPDYLLASLDYGVLTNEIPNKLPLNEFLERRYEIIKNREEN